MILQHRISKPPHANEDSTQWSSWALARMLVLGITILYRCFQMHPSPSTLLTGKIVANIPRKLFI